MVVASMLRFASTLLWVTLIGYVFYIAYQRGRGQTSKISLTLSGTLLALALVSSTLSTSIIVIDAGEVGVIFNIFSGTQDEPLMPGLHIVIPYINEVYRYSTLEQVYTMTKTQGEGEIHGDDSLWSPTSEGLQVGVDSSTRFKLDPRKAAMIHNNFRNTYVEVLVRPSIRSIVRHHVSQNTVTDVYGPKRAEIQQAITEDLQTRFEKSGLLLLSFDIRNINFTEDYATSIEQKQIAQQNAEQMQFVLQKERQEADRKKIEAEGVKQAAITRAQGESEALRLINEQIKQNENLLTYRYIEKLSPNVQVMLLPSNSPFILDMKNLLPQPTGGNAP